MKKTIYTILSMLLLCGAAAAQTGGELNRQVNVAKDYTPRVDRAAKLTIMPQMEDTVKLRPELEYRVRPRAWAAGFGVAPISAARMNSGTYLRQYPLYLKVGGGYPGQSTLDLYATSTRPGNSGFGLYVNHYGQYSRIEDAFDNKRDAASTRNRAGVFGTASFGRLSLSGELGMDYDVYTHYGNVGYYPAPADGEGYGKRMQHYAVPRAGLVFGHDFTDLSRLNFRFGADGYILMDRHEHGQTGGNAFLELGKDFGVHGVNLRADFSGWKGKDMNRASSMTIGIKPRYELKSESFTFVMGAGFAYDMPKAEYEDDTHIWGYLIDGGSRFIEAADHWGKKFWFLPELELRFNLGGGAFSPYARLESTLEQNSYLSLARRNPYLDFDAQMQAAPGATANYMLHAGISGSVGAVFSYDLFAGYEISKNYGIPVNMAEGIYSTVSGDAQLVGMIPGDFLFRFVKELKGFTAGARFGVKTGGFEASLGGRFHSYKDIDGIGEVDFMPKFEGRLDLSYTHGAKWSVRAGAAVRGKYAFHTESIPEANIDGPLEKAAELEAPAAVDITLGFDYNVSDKLGVYIEGRNLANQKMYPYAFYRGVGMSLGAGVKLRF